MNLSNHYFRLKKDIETAKQLSYEVVRNSLGVVLFMVILIGSTTIKCLFHLSFRLSDYRILVYIFVATIMFLFFKFSKSKLKPIFENVELKKMEKDKNFKLLSAISLGIIAGFSYALARLISIYC